MDTDRVFRGSIPALYEEYLVPVQFETYALEMAARLRELRLGRVLETAAGTGVLTRAMAAALPADVAIEATDLNQPMLDKAARSLSSPRVSWRQADAQALPFPDGRFDAVVCQFGAMFFPDRPLAFFEAWRVLKPGGIFLLSVWDRIEQNEFAEVVVNAVAKLFPEDPPTFTSRVPHSLHDTAPLVAELKAAGFASVAVETVDRTSTAPDARFVAIGKCQGTPLRHEIEARDASRLAEATDAATAALAARFGTGAIRGKLRAYVLTAIR
jgi:ubiquinone/menaquinone biosynthesis C-methylase UbiE